MIHEVNQNTIDMQATTAATSGRARNLVDAVATRVGVLGAIGLSTAAISLGATPAANAEQIQPPASRPTPAEQIQPPASRPTPAEQIQPPASRPTPAEQIQPPA